MRGEGDGRRTLEAARVVVWIVIVVFLEVAVPPMRAHVVARTLAHRAVIQIARARAVRVVVAPAARVAQHVECVADGWNESRKVEANLSY